MNQKEKLKSFLIKRKQDYIQTFNVESLSAIAVMEDLEKFCRGNDSCFHPDARVHAVLEGRREVLLRIKKHLDLSDDEFLKYYTNKGLKDD